MIRQQPMILRITWQNAPIEEAATEALVNASVTACLRDQRVKDSCVLMTAQEEDDASPQRR